MCLCVIYLSVNCTTMQFKLYMIYLFAHIQRFESEALGMFLNVKDEFILYTCSMNTFSLLLFHVSIAFFACDSNLINIC